MHFGLCVVTKERPTGPVLRAVMQPFSMGNDPGIEGRVEVDVTASYREDFEAFRSSLSFSGDFLDYLKEVSSYEVASEGQERDERYRYGYIRLEEGDPDKFTVIRRENPNSKWDWWVLGGRYGGIYTPGCKRGEAEYVEPKDMAADRTYPPHQMQRKDLPITELHWAKRTFWDRPYDRARAIIGDQPKPDREGFWTHPVVEAIKAEFKNEGVFLHYSEIEQFWLPKDIFLTREEDSALTLFAYIKDGHWIECSEEAFPDPLANDGWVEHFNAMLDSLDPEDWISIVDCHC